MEKGEICLDEPNQKPFIADSNTMDDVYNNINDYSPKRKQKHLCRKLNISLAFHSRRSQIKCYTLSNNEDSKYCY